MNHTTALQLAFGMLSKSASVPKELEKDPTETEAPKAVKEQSLMDRLLGAKVELSNGEPLPVKQAAARVPVPSATPATKPTPAPFAGQGQSLISGLLPKVVKPTPLKTTLPGVTPAIASAAKEGPVTADHPATK